MRSHADSILLVPLAIANCHINWRTNAPTSYLLCLASTFLAQNANDKHLAVICHIIDGVAMPRENESTGE